MAFIINGQNVRFKSHLTKRLCISMTGQSVRLSKLYSNSQYLKGFIHILSLKYQLVTLNCPRLKIGGLFKLWCNQKKDCTFLCFKNFYGSGVAGKPNWSALIRLSSTFWKGFIWQAAFQLKVLLLSLLLPGARKTTKQKHPIHLGTILVISQTYFNFYWNR